MLGIVGTIIGWILWIIWVIVFYFVKFLLYIFAILLFLLWKHQGALLYMRHAPQRKRQIAYNDHPRVRSPAHYNIPFEDFFIETKDKVSVHCWLLIQGSHSSKKNKDNTKTTKNKNKNKNKNDKSNESNSSSGGGSGSVGGISGASSSGGVLVDDEDNNEETSVNNGNSEIEIESLNYATIILFHGNAGNIGYRLPNAYAMYRYLRCNVLLVDYRGYGNSEGVPTENGIGFDCEALMDYVCNNDEMSKYIDQRKIFIFGRSLGGAVAVDLAYRYCENKMLHCEPVTQFGQHTSRIAQSSLASNNINNNNMATINTDIQETVNKKTKDGSNSKNKAKNSMPNSPNSETEALIPNGKKNNTTTSTSNSNQNTNNTERRRSTRTRTRIRGKKDKAPVEIAGVIVENTFTSILDMVFVLIEQTVQGLTGGNNSNPHSSSSSSSSSHSSSSGNTGGQKNIFLRYLRLFLKYFITNRWESVDKVDSISMPILFLSGEKDELIPPTHMHELHENCNKSEMKLWRSYEHGDHNSTWQRGGAKYYDDIAEFIALVLSRQDNNQVNDRVP